MSSTHDRDKEHLSESYSELIIICQTQFSAVTVTISLSVLFSYSVSV